jgi:hypothetical protein
LQIFLVWEFVIGGVHADGFKNLGIFGQTIFLKPRHGEFAAVNVPRLVVKHSPRGHFQEDVPMKTPSAARSAACCLISSWLKGTGNNSHSSRAWEDHFTRLKPLPRLFRHFFAASRPIVSRYAQSSDAHGPANQIRISFGKRLPRIGVSDRMVRFWHTRIGTKMPLKFQPIAQVTLFLFLGEQLRRDSARANRHPTPFCGKCRDCVGEV